MPNYYHIKDQTLWPDTIVLVQIAAPTGDIPTGLVRSVQAGVHPDGYMPLEMAFAEAEHTRLIYGLDAVGVHLEDGASWRSEWGTLVDQKGLGFP